MRSNSAFFLLSTLKNIAVCGVLVVMSYGLIGYSCFKQCRSRLAARQAAADERSNVDDSSNNISYTGTLVSRSWAYGRTQRESALNSNSRIRNGDESTSLLDNEVGGASGRLKTKNDARIYQTATEYGNDTTEYYQLPSAPATSATTE